MKIQHVLYLLLTSVLLSGLPLLLHAQCPSSEGASPFICGPPSNNNCAAWGSFSLFKVEPPPPQNLTFTFNTMADYTGGITFSGATTLLIQVDSCQTCNTGKLCKWKLVMYIDNGGGSTPANEWETMTTYGLVPHTPHKPLISLLQIRVYNGCNTPLCEEWQTFYPTDDAAIDIIKSSTLTPESPTCTENVNGYGSYQSTIAGLPTNYNEYSFTIDYRIVPSYAYTPGIYNLSLNFCLVEDDL